jgi:hypothetical protein
MRKKLDPQLSKDISNMLSEIIFDFEENGGQINYENYLKAMKFVPVYQEIPEDLRDPFSDTNVYKYFEGERTSDYMFEHTDQL